MKLILKPKLRNPIRGIDIETEIEGFHPVILISKPKLWNANGDIDIETATMEYDFYYRTSNGILKTGIAHAWHQRNSAAAKPANWFASLKWDTKSQKYFDFVDFVK